MGTATIRPRPHAALFEEAYHCCINLYGLEICDRTEEGGRSSTATLDPPPSITVLLPLAQVTASPTGPSTEWPQHPMWASKGSPPPPPLYPQRRRCRKSWRSWQQWAPPSRVETTLFDGHGAHQIGRPTAAPRTSPHPARGLKELGGEHLSLSLLLREKKKDKERKCLCY